MKKFFNFVICIALSSIGDLAIAPNIKASQSAKECEICYEENPVQQRLGCGHFMGQCCLGAELVMCQREISLANMKCIQRDCQRQITLAELEHMPFANDLLNIYKKKKEVKDASEMEYIASLSWWKIMSYAEIKNAFTIIRRN